MNTEKRIVLACFIGAALGALLALQFNHYLWWVGILIGGAVGYLSYQFKEIPGAVRTAWNSIPDSHTAIAAMRTGIRNGTFTAGCISCTIAAVLIPISAIISIGLIMLVGLMGQSPIQATRNIGLDWPLTYWFGGTISTLVAGIFLFVSVKNDEKKHDYSWLIAALLLNPIVIPVTMAVTIVCVAGFFVVMALIKVPKHCIKVVCRSFVIIHSEIRLLCMTDAMIGALIGYYYGNALVGGIAGAVCGVLNYRFISVKCLKLAKA